MVQGETLDMKRWFTRMAQVCDSDYEFHTYVELTLRCIMPSDVNSPEDYNILTQWAVGTVGSKLAAALGLSATSRKEVLFATFQGQRFEDIDKGANFKLKEDTAVCLYPMEEVEKQFRKGVDDCLQGNGQRGPAHYSPPVDVMPSLHCWKSSIPNLSSETYCNVKEKPTNWPVVGNPLQTDLAILLPNTEITGMSVTVANELYTVLTLTTTQGEIIKMEVNNATSAVVLEKYPVPADPVGLSSGDTTPSPTASSNSDNSNPRIQDVPLKRQQRKPYLVGIQREPSGEHVYVATRNTVHLVALSNCSRSTTCQDCIQMQDPFCGWCVNNGHCSSRKECKMHRTNVHWIPYSDTVDKCPIIEHMKPQAIPETLTSRVPLALQLENVPLFPNLWNEHFHDTSTTVDCVFRNSEGWNVSNKNAPIYKWSHRDDILTTIGSVGTEGLVACHTPSGAEMPIIPRDRTNVTVDLLLIVRAGDQPLAQLAQTKFYVYRCSSFNECISCTKSVFGCVFCPLENKCKDESKAHQCREQFSVLSGQSSKCPMYHIPTNKSILASGKELTVENVHLYNIHPSMMDFRCTETCTNQNANPVRVKEFTGPSSGNNLTINCSFNKLILTSWDSAKNCTVVVKFEYNSKKLPLASMGEFLLEIFDCPSLAKQCDDCLLLPRRYGCGWCNSNTVCLADYSRCLGRRFYLGHATACPDPFILSILPSRVTLDGGAILTVQGRNLGDNETDVEAKNAIMIYFQNVSGLSGPCVYIPGSYRLYKSFQCRLANMTSLVLGLRPNTAINEPIQATVVLTVRNQDQTPRQSTPLLTFMKPHVNSVYPPRGPEAGGTRVTISGSNLDIGNQLQVFWVKETRFSGRPVETTAPDNTAFPSWDCHIVFHNSTMIVCETIDHRIAIHSSADLYHSIRRRRSVATSSSSMSAWSEFTSLRLVVDGSKMSFPTITFSYVPDPVIVKISREALLASGSLLVRVYGSNLDVVVEPAFLLHYENKQYSSTCQPVNSTVMLCSTPQLPNYGGALVGEPSVLTYGFRMDGVKSLITKDMIKVFQDPVVKKFAGEKVVSLATKPFSRIHLNGEYPRDALLLSDVHVLLIHNSTVSSRDLICTVVGISVDNIECELRADREPSTSSNYIVKVIIGESIGKQGKNSRLEFIPGTIRYHGPSNFQIEPIIAAAVVIFIIIVVALTICIVLCKKRRNNKKVTMESAEREKKMAKECQSAFFVLQKEMNARRQNFGEIPYLTYQDYCRKFLIGREYYIFLDGSLVNSPKPDPHPAEPLFCETQFLIALVDTVNSLQMHTVNKRRLATLLSILLHRDLPLYTKLLLELIRNAIKTSRDPSTLFCQPLDTLQFQLLANWFTFLLYPCVLERVGDPLFTLYSALLTKLREGPVDAETHLSRYTLNFEYLLNTELEEKKEGPVQLKVYDRTGKLFSPDECLMVRVLLLDAIVQVKEKILDAHYKNRPQTRRTQTKDVDLYLIQKPSTTDGNQENESLLPKRTFMEPMDEMHHFKLKEYTGEDVDEVIVELEIHTNDVDSSYSSMHHSSVSPSVPPSQASRSPTSTPLNCFVTIRSGAPNVATNTGTNRSSRRAGNGNAMSQSPPMSPFHGSTSGAGDSTSFPPTPEHGVTTEKWNRINVPNTNHTSTFPRRKHLVSLSEDFIQQQEDELPPTLCLNSGTLGSGDVIPGTANYMPLKPLSSVSQTYSQSTLDSAVQDKSTVATYSASNSLRRPSRTSRKNKTSTGTHRSLHNKTSHRHTYPKQIYFNYVLHTKMVVQMYIDDLMEAIFSSVYRDKQTPICVKYFFDFLDRMAESHDDTLRAAHLWKTNSLCRLYWEPLIKNPQYIFDMDAKESVVKCLHVIANVLLNACGLHRGSPVSSKELPLEQQLFAQECERYSKMVRNYYDSLRLLPEENATEFDEMLRAHTASYSLSWSPTVVLGEIWDTFVKPNKEQIRRYLPDSSPVNKMFTSLCG